MLLLDLVLFVSVAAAQYDVLTVSDEASKGNGFVKLQLGSSSSCELQIADSAVSFGTSVTIDSGSFLVTGAVLDGTCSFNLDGQSYVALYSGSVTTCESNSAVQLSTVTSNLYSSGLISLAAAAVFEVGCSLLNKGTLVIGANAQLETALMDTVYQTHCYQSEIGVNSSVVIGASSAVSLYGKLMVSDHGSLKIADGVSLTVITGFTVPSGVTVVVPQNFIAMDYFSFVNDTCFVLKYRQAVPCSKAERSKYVEETKPKQRVSARVKQRIGFESNQDSLWVAEGIVTEGVDIAVLANNGFSAVQKSDRSLRSKVKLRRLEHGLVQFTGDLHISRYTPEQHTTISTFTPGSTVHLNDSSCLYWSSMLTVSSNVVIGTDSSLVVLEDSHTMSDPTTVANYAVKVL